MEQTSSKVTTAKTHNTRALWNLTRGQRRRFAMAGVALVIGTVFMFVGPQIVRFAIDAFLDRSKPAGQLPDWMARGQAMLDATARPYRALFLAALGVFIASLISGAFMYLKGRFAAQASESIARSLRMRLYDHLQHLPVAYHDKSPTGDQVQRCTSDVDTVRMMFSSQ